MTTGTWHNSKTSQNLSHCQALLVPLACDIWLSLFHRPGQHSMKPDTLSSWVDHQIGRRGQLRPSDVISQYLPNGYLNPTNPLQQTGMAPPESPSKEMGQPFYRGYVTALTRRFGCQSIEGTEHWQMLALWRMVRERWPGCSIMAGSTCPLMANSDMT